MHFRNTIIAFCAWLIYFANDRSVEKGRGRERAGEREREEWKMVECLHDKAFRQFSLLSSRAANTVSRHADRMKIINSCSFIIFDAQIFKHSIFIIYIAIST